MFQKIDVKTLTENPFELIDDRWALIAAGDENRYNGMTASWVQLGILWNKPVVSIYVRPQRYTYEFTEKSDYFTLTFFKEGEWRQALNLFGSKSGRDMDKFAAAGLTVARAECGAPYAAEGELVLVCRKLYVQDLKEDCFVDHAVVDSAYPKQDFHRMYVGEIVEAYHK